VSAGVALSALLVTLARPATWPLALAAFLLRGGLLLVALPIVVLPSPVGFGNLLAPTLMTVVFQGVSIEVAAAIGLLVLAIVGWVVVGGLVAAMLEADGARIVATDDDLAADADASRGPASRDGAAAPAELPPRGIPARILAVRVLAHVPTGIALIWGTARLVAVAYGELTSPIDVTSPIAVRVLRGAPEVVIVLVGLWMMGEIVGGIAARRVSLAGAGVRQALRDAVVAALRRPVPVLLGFWVPAAGLVLVVTPFALAATAAVRAVRAALRTTSDPFGATVAVVLFVTIWLVGLAMIAVTAAWRGAVWTVVHGAVWGRGRQRGGIEPA
jgi:hypothetical protein